VRALAARFAARGFPFLPMQARQADRPAGAVWLANPIGSAPGFALAHGGGLVVVLPGVPAEMRAMFDEHVVPRLAPSGIARRALHVAGKSEAAVETALADLYGEEGVEVTILAGRDGVDLHLLPRRRATGKALERVGRVEQRMIERLGSDLYGTGEETLARAVGTGLVALGRTVAVAESCTAGLLAAALTSVPGSSAWFRGGFLPYADDLKVGLCGVDPALLAAHGAVSEPVCARWLAERATARAPTSAWASAVSPGRVAERRTSRSGSCTWRSPIDRARRRGPRAGSAIGSSCARAP
jgi:nicotinamide-nucleotide amidase